MSAEPQNDRKFKESAVSVETVRLVTNDSAQEQSDCLAAEHTEDPTEQTADSNHNLAENLNTSQTESASAAGNASADSNFPQYSPGSSMLQSQTHQLTKHSGLTGRSIFPDLKQVLNCAYFTAAALAAAELVSAFDNVMFYGMAALCGVIASAAFVYSLNQRVHISDFAITFSRRTRRMIRATALLLPIPIFVAVSCARLAANEVAVAEQLYDADQYARAMTHLESAQRLNPFSQGTYEAISRVFYAESIYPQALEYAEKAISMDPTDSYAWVDKAKPLHEMKMNDAALVAAQKAIDLDRTNGQAFATMAETYNEMGMYDQALEAAQTHVTLHNTEAYAYEIKEQVLRNMGRDADAAAARAEASRMGSPVE